MAEEANVLRGEDALELARQGKEAWNEWAMEHDGWKVSFANAEIKAWRDGRISFAYFYFPGEADFSGTTFRNFATFDRTEFGGPVNFSNSTFLGQAIFNHTKVPVGVDFRDSIFHKRTIFREINFYHVVFTKTLFESEVLFRDVEFRSGAEFTNATFKREANFDSAQFFALAKFRVVTFEHVADFRHAVFSSEADFRSSKFLHALELDKATFGQTPNFQSTKIDHHVSMDDIRVKFSSKKIWKFWDRAAEPWDAPKYRRLKEMAALAQDHYQEQKFFAYELKAMRGTRVKGISLIPNLLYETFSDFGRSLTRPTYGLSGVLFGFALLHTCLAYKSKNILELTSDTLTGWVKLKLESLSYVWDLFLSSLLYSATNILPFIGGSGSAKKEMAKKLFGKSIPEYIHWLNMTEGLFALIFIFLFGLALRNRFRI